MCEHVLIDDKIVDCSREFRVFTDSFMIYMIELVVFEMLLLGQK